MVQLLTDIRTPYRRPCLTRMLCESQIDRQTDRRGSPRAHNGYPFSFVSGGSGPIDERALTIDHESRMSPRCVGIHRGRLNSPMERAPSSKADTVRTLQAFGMSNNSDLDLIEKKRSCSTSPNPMNRNKFEAMQGVPLSGAGADISLAGGRRLQGFEMRDRQASPPQVKKSLSAISIEHQFQRRHQSCPPESRECRSGDMFEHMLKAEAYAYLLDRPEGILRRHSQRKTLPALTVLRRCVSARCRSSSAEMSARTRYSPSSANVENCNELHRGQPNEPIEEVSGGDVAAGSARQADHQAPLSLQSANLITALREKTKNMPAEAVWDAMLKLVAESPQLSPNAPPGSRLGDAEASLMARVAAAVAETSSASGSRGSSPSPRRAKKRSDSQASGSNSSPRRERRGSPRCRAGTSDLSVFSHTTADTMTQLSQPPSVKSCLSHTSSSGSLRSSDSLYLRVRGNARQSLAAKQLLVEERRKAARRAAWIA